jgi:hypothetical protein
MNELDEAHADCVMRVTQLNIEIGLAVARQNEVDAALTALYTAARGDAEGQWWPIRKWMDEQGIFNGDIESYQRLSEIVLKHLLADPPAQTPDRPSVKHENWCASRTLECDCGADYRELARLLRDADDPGGSKG